MKNDGDKGDLSPAPDPASSPRITFVRSALHVVIAVIALAALATSIPHWGGDEFPVMSLVIYVAGMVFIAMPLCLLYEALLKSQQERTGNRGWSV
jgi:putative Ca2+/H+ antiporter (TMEM165/GDT1 family)